MEGYKDLIVWQKAMQLVRLVYTVARSFPADERFALTDQLRRAAVSIPSNIAEGNGRATNRDYAHFLAVARGSLYEMRTQLQLAQDFGYVESQPEIETVADEVGRMLTAMMKKSVSLMACPQLRTSHHRTPTPNTYT